MLLLHTYLSRKKRLHTDMRLIRSQCQELVRKYRRNIHILNNLIFILLSLLDNPLQINHRSTWCEKKLVGGGMKRCHL